MEEMAAFELVDLWMTEISTDARNCMFKYQLHVVHVMNCTMLYKPHFLPYTFTYTSVEARSEE